jgi:hypothetical protein
VREKCQSKQSSLDARLARAVAAMGKIVEKPNPATVGEGHGWSQMTSSKVDIAAERARLMAMPMRIPRLL